MPRSVGLDERFAKVLPDVLITLGPDEFAALAAQALAPKPEPMLGLAHLHAPQVSVREQAALIVDRLRRTTTTTFRALVHDSPDTLTTVARFLALLELFREGAVAFDQVTPLGELSVRWTGAEDGEIEVGDEYDDHAAEEEQVAESVTDEDIRAIGQTSSTDRGAAVTIESETASAEQSQPRPTEPTESIRADARSPTRSSVQGALNVAEHELKPALEAVLDDRRHAAGPSEPGAGRRRDARMRSRPRWPSCLRSTPSRDAASTCAQAGAGWRFYTREEFAPIIEQFVVDGQQARLTQAALETLAVVAYRQPVSRARVSAIRGVNVDGVMRTLLNRGAGRGGRQRPRDRRAPVPHDVVLPRADGADQPRGAAGDRAAPAGDGRRSKASPTWLSWSRTRVVARRCPTRRADAAAEGAGPGRRGQPAQVRDADV